MQFSSSPGYTEIFGKHKHGSPKGFKTRRKTQGMYHLIKGIMNVKSLHDSWNLTLNFWGTDARKTVCAKPKSQTD